MRSYCRRNAVVTVLLWWRRVSRRWRSKKVSNRLSDGIIQPSHSSEGDRERTKNEKTSCARRPDLARPKFQGQPLCDGDAMWSRCCICCSPGGTVSSSKAVRWVAAGSGACGGFHELNDRFHGDIICFSRAVWRKVLAAFCKSVHFKVDSKSCLIRLRRVPRAA